MENRRAMLTVKKKLTWETSLTYISKPGYIMQYLLSHVLPKMSYSRTGRKA